jgi:GNAT superfamily N-acetyltransferase
VERGALGLVGSAAMDTTTAVARRLDRAELPACVALAADRGWAPERRKWGLLFDIGSVWAVDDPAGGLAAMVTLAPYGESLAAVGMMVVATRHGRRGLGRLLMERVIAEAGDALVTLYATETGRPLYEQVGLAGIGESTRYVGTWTGDALERTRTRLVTSADHAAVRALDLAGFGADRGTTLARLPSFAEEIRVAESGGELVGYAARWLNGPVATIGPVVAPDASTAAALVAALACGVGGRVRVDVHDGHGELESYLAQHGLERGSTTTVMTTAGRPLPGDASRRFAPLTVATG